MPSEVQGGGHGARQRAVLRHWPEEPPSSDRDCRPAGGIMGLVGAPDAAAARVSPGKRIEVEPCLGTGVTHRLEATAALGARDGRVTAIANGDEWADLGLRGVDHQGSRLSDQSGGIGGELGRKYSPPLYRDFRWRRPARSAAVRDRPGCDPVAAAGAPRWLALDQGLVGIHSAMIRRPRSRLRPRLLAERHGRMRRARPLQ